jgi:hypothetical protein
VDEGGRPVMPLKTKGKFIQDDHGVAMGFLSTYVYLRYALHVARD